MTGRKVPQQRQKWNIATSHMRNPLVCWSVWSTGNLCSSCCAGVRHKGQILRLPRKSLEQNRFQKGAQTSGTCQLSIFFLASKPMNAKCLVPVFFRIPFSIFGFPCESKTEFDFGRLVSQSEIHSWCHWQWPHGKKHPTCETSPQQITHSMAVHG